jgi:shikimate kinase
MALNPRAQWIRMMEERRPTYERLASLRVLTAGRTPQEIATEIAHSLDEKDGHSVRSSPGSTDE